MSSSLTYFYLFVHCSYVSTDGGFSMIFSCPLENFLPKSLKPKGLQTDLLKWECWD